MKRDNFLSVNKDAKTHPTIGKELFIANKEIETFFKMVAEIEALMEKAKKQAKSIKV